MRTAHRFHLLGGPVMIGLFCLSPLAQGGIGPSAGITTAGQIEVPTRPANPLFKSEQANQKTETHFDPASGVVTLKTVIQDPRGYFVPNIRRENFVVYEDGVRQDATVEIEHAPVSLAVLMEWGGRSRAVLQRLGLEVPQAARELFNHLGRNDQIGIWRYGDGLEPVVDFTAAADARGRALTGPSTPEFSETNLHDALIAALHNLDHAAHRKGLVLISSGVDTFSQTRYEDLLRAVRESGVPIYIVDAGSPLRRSAENALRASPYPRIDWQRARAGLREIAEASGGRWYSIDEFVGLSGIYDDIMESLRVRYVVRYKPNLQENLHAARNVRIELVNPMTGGPLEIIDAAGKPVDLKIVAESQYVPSGKSVGDVAPQVNAAAGATQTPSSSTSNTSVAFGGITPPAPWAP
jgi:Ca-activated chloride channel homolog